MDKKVAIRLLAAGVIAIVVGGLIGWKGADAVGAHPIEKGVAVAALGCCFLVSGIKRYLRPQQPD